MTLFLNLINMGGYGIYVWPAYGLVSFLFALHLFLPWKRSHQLKQKQKAKHVQTQ